MGFDAFEYSLTEPRGIKVIKYEEDLRNWNQVQAYSAVQVSTKKVWIRLEKPSADYNKIIYARHFFHVNKEVFFPFVCSKRFDWSVIKQFNCIL